MPTPLSRRPITSPMSAALSGAYAPCMGMQGSPLGGDSVETANKLVV
jgi:hypothetical protein